MGERMAVAPFCPQILSSNSKLLLIFKYGVTCGLVLLSELSSTSQFVALPLVLNGGERLALAYLLVALKTDHFFAPRFLMSFGFLTLIGVIFGEVGIVQVGVLLLALHNTGTGFEPR